MNLGDHLVCGTLLPTQVGSSSQPTIVHASSMSLSDANSNEVLKKDSNGNITGALMETQASIGSSMDGSPFHQHETTFASSITNVAATLLGAIQNHFFSQTVGESTTSYWQQKLFPRSTQTNASQQPLLLQASSLSNDVQVGINVATPTCDLDVGGDVNFGGALKCSGDPGNPNQVLTSNGTGSAVSWSSAVVVYQNNKTLASTGVTEFFSIPRNTAQSLIIELRIVSGSQSGYAMLWHGITGIVFTGNEIFIKDTEVRANSNFQGGGSAYVPSYVESPSNTELDIRVQSNTGDTNFVRAYLTVWCSAADPTVTLR